MKYYIIGDDNFWYTTGDTETQSIEESLNEIKENIKTNSYERESTAKYLYVIEGEIIQTVDLENGE